MSCFVAIIIAVPEEKIFEGNLLYMGIVVILFIRPGLYNFFKYIGSPFIQVFPIKFYFDW